MNTPTIDAVTSTSSAKTYHPHSIEPFWQAIWQQNKSYEVTENASKPKFFACSMLPYPSGKLHMGHVRNYVLNDVMTRYLRMKGFSVLMPMGWDAFGMPAENAAIANKISPDAWTRQNILDMKTQMAPLGLAIDWSREISTCDASYYRWNQWFFLKMREAGIAYRAKGMVNWDPVDQTVLANEQVIDGRGWRSGALVEKREIPMYYLKITKYSDELLQDLDALGWPERVKLMQKNWIGKSQGVRLAFKHKIAEHADIDDATRLGDTIWAFTTRADTVMGVTFCAIAAMHPLATHIAKSRPELAKFIAQCAKGSVMEADLAHQEKLGVFTGYYVTHPISGAAIPLWVANYVLMSYGDGAVMGVPAHDERDFAFANKYRIPIQQAVDVGVPFSVHHWHDAYGRKDGCAMHEPIAGQNFTQATQTIAGILSERGLGHAHDTYRLRDWGISRQRYWGTPIPVIHCPKCGEVAVPEKDLPVVLPPNLNPDGAGNILTKTPSFYETHCPQCGTKAKRETDTMDTFVDSCWYFMRYACPDATSMVDARVQHWMPMDQYIGGIEHAILHLLYARFWTKAMNDLGLINFREPFSNLLTQGMVLNDSFYREDEQGKKTWFYPEEVHVERDAKGHALSAVLEKDGLPVERGGIEKMSKSKNNVVEPKALIAEYGVDTARLFSMFAAPPEASLEWNDDAVEGAYRYLRRLWSKVEEHSATLKAYHASQPSPAVPDHEALPALVQDTRFNVHSILKQALFDFERIQYNTVVSACMKLLNAIEDYLKAESSAVYNIQVLSEAVGILLRVLYPIVPHICCGLWQNAGFDAVFGDLLDAPVPVVDEAALVQTRMELVLQINGKTKGSMVVDAQASIEAIEAAARAQLPGDDATRVVRVVVVPGRLVNVVLKPL